MRGMRIATALLGLCLVIGPACKKDKGGSGTTEGSGVGSAATGSDTGSGSGSADTGAGSADTGAGSGDTGSAATGAGAGSSEQMTKRGGNCPSTVFGSTTKAELKGGKILVTITSADKDAVVAIQKRSAELVKEKTDGGASGDGHDQKGTHGGGMGLCPVHVAGGAAAEVKNEADGVVVTITPKEKPELLKTEIDGRITKAAEWVKANIKEGEQGTQGGVGGGAGEHGMNHSGDGDGKGKEKGGDGKGGGKGTGGGGGAGTGGGGGNGTGGGGSAAK